MQIKVINNSSSAIVLPGDVTCAAGATRTVTGRTEAELSAFQQLHSDGEVIIEGTLEDADKIPLVCDMKAPADPAGGVNTLAAVGFDLEDEQAAAFSAQPEMYLGVFDDVALTTPSVNGTLDTAAAGAIDAGAGTNLLEVTPSATGEMSVTLTQTDDIQCWVKAWPKTTVARIIDCSDVHAPTFTA
jgi:hypothetical protein